MVAVGDLITAAQYNTLQSRIATILGTGSGQNGYGQTLSSSTVSAAAIIQAAEMDNLLVDMNAARTHQVGSGTGLSNLDVGDIIGADASGADTTAGFNDYLDAMTTIEGAKFTIAGTQSDVEAATSSQRTSNWGAVGDISITHEFTVTFDDADHRRHFFNSGGEIRFSANISGQSGAKSNDWATMLSNAGTISMGYTATTTTGTGTAAAIGNFDLNTGYQEIFSKSGTGNYAENEFTIQAKANSTSQLQFLVTFRDADLGDQVLPGSNPGSDGIIVPGPAEDEAVNGTITSTVQQLRAIGSNVEVASPSYSNVSTL